MCGDSTIKENVERLLDGIKADMVFTDPPYGIDWMTDYKRFSSGSKAQRKTYSKVEGDTSPFDPSFLFALADRHLMFGANCYSDRLPLGNWIVWDKRFENDSAFLADAEVAWYNGSGAVYIIKETSQGFTHSDDAKYHPTQKPVKLLAKVMEKITAPNILIDLYIGSGSTLIACEQTDRTCYGMELDPHYIDVIRKRYWKFMNNGQEAGWQEGTKTV